MFNILSYSNNFYTVHNQGDCTKLHTKKNTVFVLVWQTFKTLHMSWMFTFYF